jgi:hypothetical protein
MQYKGFEITAFEQTPGKWRARIIRANGKPWKGNHRELLESLTGTHLSAVDALTLAMEAVDAARVLLRTSETSGSSPYPLAKKKHRRGRVSGQVGVPDYILREQELYKLWPAYPASVTDITVSAPRVPLMRRWGIAASRPLWSVEELGAMTAGKPMTAEQAATLRRLAEAAYERDAFKPNLTRGEADLRIAILAAKLKLLDGPPHTL